jgi:serine/threonine protein kinase
MHESEIVMKNLLKRHSLTFPENISKQKLTRLVICFMIVMNDMDTISHHYTFTKVKQLAKGGMGQTWIVKRQEDGKFFVMKKSLRQSKLEIKKQYDILKKIQHINYRGHPVTIAPEAIYIDPLNLYFIMTYYPNYRTLEEYIREKKVMSLDLKKIIIMDLLLAVNILHSNDIVHCDIKPSNIMIGINEPVKVKIIDFGLAKNSNTVFQQSPGLGTFLYMPPELLTQIDLDHAVVSLPRPHCFYDYIKYDLWATGLCLLYVINKYHNPIFYGIRSIKELQIRYQQKDIETYIMNLDKQLNDYLSDKIDSRFSEVHLLSYSPSHRQLIIQW